MTERIDGPAFVSHLRAMLPVDSTPVIAMSTGAVFKRYGDRLQVAGTLLKPITQTSLSEVLEQYR